MPPKASPKIYQILIRTHKTTIFLTVPPSMAISSLKKDILEALSSHLNDDPEIPQSTEIDQFSLCRAVAVNPKGKGTGKAPAGVKREYYDILDSDDQDVGTSAKATIRELKLANWEVLYVQFKDAEGNPLPIVATDPSIDDEEFDVPMSSAPSEPLSSPVNKGKRKARDDADDE